MNQGRIWCVVNPTVGLPLLLGSVALTSLAIHAAVLSHTTWYGNSYQGAAKKEAMNGTASVAALASRAEPAFTITVAPVAATAGRADASFMVTVAPSAAGQAAHAVTLAQAK